MPLSIINKFYLDEEKSKCNTMGRDGLIQIVIKFKNVHINDKVI